MSIDIINDILISSDLGDAIIITESDIEEQKENKDISTYVYNNPTSVALSVPFIPTTLYQVAREFTLNTRKDIINQLTKVNGLIQPYNNLFDRPISPEYTPVFNDMLALRRNIIKKLASNKVLPKLPDVILVGNIVLLSLYMLGVTTPQKVFYRVSGVINTLFDNLAYDGLASIKNSFNNFFNNDHNSDLSKTEPLLFNEYLNKIMGRDSGMTGSEYHLKTFESFSNPKALNGSYNFAGPNTNLTKRLTNRLRSDGYPLPESYSQPINELDEASFRHDLDYSRTNGTRARQIIDNAYTKELNEILDSPTSSTSLKSDVRTVLKLFETKRSIERIKGNFPDPNIPRIRYNETNSQIGDNYNIFTGNNIKEEPITIESRATSSRRGNIYQISPRNINIKLNKKKINIDILPFIIKLYKDDDKKIEYIKKLLNKIKLINKNIN